MGPRPGLEPLAGPQAPSPGPPSTPPPLPPPPPRAAGAPAPGPRVPRRRRDVDERALRPRIAPEAAGLDLLSGGRIEAMPSGGAAFVRARLADGAHEPRLRPQREHALHVQVAF